MRRTPLAAMLTLLVAVAIAGCGGKAGSGPTKSTTTTGIHKQPSRPPAY